MSKQVRRRIGDRLPRLPIEMHLACGDLVGAPHWSILNALIGPGSASVDAHRLRSLIRLVLDDYKRQQMAQRFQEVVAKLKNWANSPSEDHAREYSQSLNELRDAVSESRIHELMPLQRQLLAAIHGERFVGRDLIDSIEQATKNANTPADALPKVNALKVEFDNFVGSLQQLDQNFENLGIESHTPKAGIEEISIILPDELTRLELAEIEELIHAWNQAVTYVQELVTGRVEALKVVSFDRGSLVIIIGVSYSVALAMLTVVNRALEAYKRFVDIRKVQEEIKGLKLSNGDAQIKLLRESEAAETDSAIERIAMSLVGEHFKAGKDGKDERTGRTRPEFDNQIKRSVKFVLNQIDHGVQIEILLLPPPPTVEDKEGKPGKQENYTSAIEEIKMAPHKWRELPKQDKPILQLGKPDLDEKEQVKS